MSFFSIENVLNQKIIKNMIDINFYVIKNNLIQKRENKLTTNTIPLSLIHPKNCQPKIPIKDSCSILRPYLKTIDDIFDIQSAINSILSNSDDLEYKNTQFYYKWECENFSEEYGYTHFYVVVSLIHEINERSYYVIEIIRLKGTKSIIYYILNELTNRLNILP